MLPSKGSTVVVMASSLEPRRCGKLKTETHDRDNRTAINNLQCWAIEITSIPLAPLKERAKLHSGME
jgi:hypothetical protein